MAQPFTRCYVNPVSSGIHGLNFPMRGKVHGFLEATAIKDYFVPERSAVQEIPYHWPIVNTYYVIHHMKVRNRKSLMMDHI